MRFGDIERYVRAGYIGVDDATLDLVTNPNGTITTDTVYVGEYNLSDKINELERIVYYLMDAQQESAEKIDKLTKIFEAVGREEILKHISDKDICRDLFGWE